MNTYQETLLALLRAALFQEPFKAPAETDWAKVYEEAAAQAVHTLVAPVVPAAFAAPFRQAQLTNRANYMRLLYEQKAVLSLLSEAKIPAVLLKGVAAAKYYPVPSNRGMGDVDLLVPEEDYPRATALLNNNGYAFLFENQRHTEVQKNGIMIEVHRRFSSKEVDIESFLADAFPRVREETVDGNTFPVFPEAENGLVLLAHLRHHFKRSGLGLRHLTDWAMFVHAHPEEAFWTETFLPMAQSAGLLRFSLALTRLCRDRLGLSGSVPGCEEIGESLSDRLLERFLNDGNFGEKVEEKENPMEAVTVRVRNGSFFSLLQSAGQANWKACQKHPFLRRFAFIYQFFRFLGKGIARLFSGKMRKDLKSGNEKYTLYRDLDI